MADRTFTVEFRYGIDHWLGDLALVYADHLHGGDTHDATDLDTLTALAEMSKVIDEQIGRIARIADATWQQIGDALGVSRQGAHKRFARP